MKIKKKTLKEFLFKIIVIAIVLTLVLSVFVYILR